MSRDRDTGKALQCASAGEVTERGSIDVGRCSRNVTITMLAFHESRAPIEVTRRKRCSALYQFPPPTLATVTTLGPATSSSPCLAAAYARWGSDCPRTSRNSSARARVLVGTRTDGVECAYPLAAAAPVRSSFPHAAGNVKDGNAAVGSFVVCNVDGAGVAEGQRREGVGTAAAAPEFG